LLTPTIPTHYQKNTNAAIRDSRDAIYETPYKVEEIAQLLAISSRAAYNLCKSTKDFKVIRIGKSVRVNKQSFDNWLASA